MIPTRLFSGKIKIIRAYLGKSLIFQSVALLFANAKLKLQNNLSPKKAEARVLSCDKEDATKSNSSVTTASAAEISFGKQMKAKIASTLVAYRRAAMEYVRRTGTKLLGKLRSTAGKNATAIRKVTSRLLALLVSAAVKILHLGNMIHTAAASKLDTSGTKPVTAARAMENETCVNPVNVTGVTANVSTAAAVAHVATLTTFVEPEPGADDVLPEQQLEFKDGSTSTGCYYVSATLNVTLTEGVTYTVSWDGQLYKCVARKMGMKNYFATYRMTALGDPKNYPFFLGSSYPNTPVDDEVGGKGEPFFIHISSGKTDVGIKTLDTSATHTVRIYVEQ